MSRYIVRDHIVRPQIEELLRLLPHFTLGIFSSATKRTVNTAMGVIHRKLREAAAAKGVGETWQHAGCSSSSSNSVISMRGKSPLTFSIITSSKRRYKAQPTTAEAAATMFPAW